MDKHTHYLLFLMVFMFGFQDLAIALQTCPETGRDSAPFESHKSMDEMDTNCHDRGADKTDVPENCDARHCCPGATFSSVYPTGHLLDNVSKTHIDSLHYAYIYSSLTDIFHPPRFSL